MKGGANYDMHRPVRFAVCMLLGFVISRCARADCPESCITASAAGMSFNYCTSAAQLDTTFSLESYGSGIARLDVPNGKLYAQVDGIAPTTVVEDEFMLVGLPAGTAVPLNARLATMTSGFCVFLGTIFHASVAEVGGSEIDLRWTDVDPVQFPLLNLPIQAIAGEPFRMRYMVTCGSECSAWIEGTFDFDGLPNGTSLVSCKGFSEEAVSVRRATWGYFKALYR